MRIAIVQLERALFFRYAVARTLFKPEQPMPRNKAESRVVAALNEPRSEYLYLGYSSSVSDNHKLTNNITLPCWL